MSVFDHKLAYILMVVGCYAIAKGSLGLLQLKKEHR
jgi:hypothetical protein